jgi:hypothetical protein
VLQKSADMAAAATAAAAAASGMINPMPMWLQELAYI